MTTLWAAIVVLGVLILVHELGHFLAARSIGVRVDRFSIGFPPRLLSFTSVDDGWEFRLFFYRRDESGKLSWGPIKNALLSRSGNKGSLTEYCFAVLPLGGYVRVAGVIDEGLDDTIENQPYELMSKPKWAQIWFMSAGILMNIILAYVLFTGVAWYTGAPETSNEPVIAELIEGMPAQEAGLKTGDRVIQINNEPITTWAELSSTIHGIPNTKITLTVERESHSFEQALVTSFQIHPSTGDTLGAIGVYQEIWYRPVGLTEAMGLGFNSTVNGFGMIINTLRMLISGRASPRELGGPIMIAQLAGRFAEQGWRDLLFFMALISVNLAFVNLLPIPGLDGGHIFVTLIEALIRRPLRVKTRMMIQQVGMAFLLLLMVLVMYNDLARLFTG